MTPRTEMEAVPVTATLEDLLQVAETTRHSQLPVYERTLDNIIGILHLRELFKHRNTPHAFALRASLRAPLIVPDRKDAAELLEDMRANHCHIAILVDEYGGTAGMATLRDLLEALVGRIDDVPPAPDGITREGGVETDGSVLLDGLMRVEEFEEAAGLRVEEESHEGVETLGGLIAAKLGRIPDVGEQIGEPVALRFDTDPCIGIRIRNSHSRAPIQGRQRSECEAARQPRAICVPPYTSQSPVATCSQ